MIPAIIIFGTSKSAEMNADRLFTRICNTFEKSEFIILVCEMEFYLSLKRVVTELNNKDFRNVLLGKVEENILRPKKETPPEVSVDGKDKVWSFCGREATIPSKFENEGKVSLIFVGFSSSPTFSVLHLTYQNRFKIFCFEPTETTVLMHSDSPLQITPLPKKSLMRRFYLTEKLKDSKVVGIIAGTLGIEHSKKLLWGISNMLKKAGKKVYVSVVGKLNEAKLGNLSSAAPVDIFVLISCPESVLTIDHTGPLDGTQSWMTPIASAWEVLVGLGVGGMEWQGTWQGEIAEMVAQIETNNNITCNMDVVGELKSTKELISIDHPNQVGLSFASWSPAAVALSERSWKGLEVVTTEKFIQTEIQQGLVGIPMKYSKEGSEK
jgi:diphthamide biosynthesis enzyme Dph1/Dph2-like protein